MECGEERGRGGGEIVHEMFYATTKAVRKPQGNGGVELRGFMWDESTQKQRDGKRET